MSYERRGGASREEVARVLGCSTGRVWQIEQAALAKCRAWLDRRGLSYADLAPDGAPGWVWPDGEGEE